MEHSQKTIACHDCGQQVAATGRRQLYCPDCRRARKRVAVKRFMQERKNAAANGTPLEPYCAHCKGRHPHKVEDIDATAYTRMCLHCGYTDTFVKSKEYFDL